jgi:LDH2 family malate/lactate/ureidoglycolate dehydrogenase
MVVDILSGVLSGATISTLMQPAPEARGNYSDHFFGALNIASFLPVEKFKESMDNAIEAIESLPTLPGVDRVTVPGCYEDAIVRERSANGIPLEAKVIDDLKALAEEMGIEYNL